MQNISKVDRRGSKRLLFAEVVGGLALLALPLFAFFRTASQKDVVDPWVVYVTNDVERVVTVPKVVERVRTNIVERPVEVKVPVVSTVTVEVDSAGVTLRDFLPVESQVVTVTNTVEQVVTVTNNVEQVVTVTNNVERVVTVTNNVEQIVTVTNEVERVAPTIVERIFTNVIEQLVEVKVPVLSIVTVEVDRATGQLADSSSGTSLEEITAAAPPSGEDPAFEDLDDVDTSQIDSELLKLVTNKNNFGSRLVFVTNDVERVVTVTNNVERVVTVTSNVERVVKVTNDVERLVYVTNDVERLVHVTNDVERLVYVTNNVERVVTVPKIVERVVKVTNDVERLVYVTNEVVRTVPKIVEQLVYVTNEVVQVVPEIFERVHTNYVERLVEVPVVSVVTVEVERATWVMEEESSETPAAEIPAPAQPAAEVPAVEEPDIAIPITIEPDEPRIEDPVVTIITQEPRIVVQKPVQAKPQPPQPAPRLVLRPEYVIRRGDMISRLAKRYGFRIQDFKAVNPELTNINRLRVGQRVRFPGFYDAALFPGAL